MFLVILHLLAFLATGAVPSRAAPGDEPTVRILFLTDCAPYSDWQSIAMVHSYMYSGHRGPITRVMCCSEEDRKKYNPDMLDLVETHIAPSYVYRPLTGDAYLAYNKPGAVIDYMEKVTPPEEWLVVLDSDMLVRSPWRVKDFNLSEGWAVGSEYGYLKGVHNELADRHIPEIAKRNDTFAGPVGRRSDMVGGFFFIHRNDLKRLSTLWLKYAEDVRADPEAYHLTGDVYAVKPGMKPWIAEMYGYSYGAAKANVWHHWDAHSMLYPGYLPGGIPRVLHYGLEWEVQGYKYDKHWYTHFNPFKCPQWDLAPQHPQEGLFPHPPHPKDLKSSTLTDRYRDLISIEGAASLNAGLCFWHRRRCPASEQLTKECDRAEDIYFATREALVLAEAHFGCHNMHGECENWAKRGECQSAEFHGYMASTCRPACGYCKQTSDASEAAILQQLSTPRGTRLAPQQITGAGPKFRLDWKGAAAAATTTVGNADAKAATPATATVTIIPTAPATIPVVVLAADKKDGAAAGADAAKAQETKGQAGTNVKDTKDATLDKATTATTITESTPAKAPVQAQTTTTTTTAAATTTTTSDAASTGTPAGAEGVVQVHKGAHPAGHVKELVKRCYHLRAATVDQVKDCMTAAKRGERWEYAGVPTRRRTAEVSEGVTGAHAINSAKANADQVRRATAHLHPADTVIMADQQTHTPVSITAPAPWRLRAVLGHGFGYHILGVWGLLVLLYLLPSTSCWRRRRISTRGSSPGGRKEHV